MSTNVAESSGSANALSRARNQTPAAQPAPPGFESFYLTERSKLTTAFEAFVLPLHWGLVRGGLRLRTNDANPTAATIPMSELSEMMPSNWKSKITTKTEEGFGLEMREIVLRYWDCSNSNILYGAKVVEVVKNNAIVVTLFRAVNAYGVDGKLQLASKMDLGSNGLTQNASATNFQVGEYLTPVLITACVNTSEEYSLSPAENKPWYEIYKNLQGFEKLVWEQLMDPIGLQVGGFRTGKVAEGPDSILSNMSLLDFLNDMHTMDPNNMEDAPMLFVPLKVAGFDTIGFVDCGSKATIMSMACAEKCLILDKIDKSKAGVAKGLGKREILGKIDNVDLTIGATKMRLAIAVMIHFPADIIIGLDALRKYHCDISLHKKALVIGETGEEIPFLSEDQLPNGGLLLESDSDDDEDEDMVQKDGGNDADTNEDERVDDKGGKEEVKDAKIRKIELI